MEENKPNKNSITLNVSLSVLAVVMLVILAQYFYSRTAYTFTDDASIQQHLVPVNARVGGFIQTLNFDEFTHVNKGDTLAIIDPTDYKIHLAQAEAGLEDVLANKEVLKSTVRTLENAQEIANAGLKEIEARLWNAEQNYRRFEELVNEKSATEQQFDQVKTEYESLKARYNASVKSAEGARLATIEARARLKAIEAGIKQAEAGVQVARQNLAYTIVLAPTDGITGRRDVNTGQLVQQGQGLVQIVDESHKWVTANFLEKQASELTENREVSIKIDALSDTEITGRIQSVAGATGSVFSLIPTDNATGNFVKIQQRIPVNIEIDGNTSAEVLNHLRAGMNVEVFVK